MPLSEKLQNKGRCLFACNVVPRNCWRLKYCMIRVLWHSMGKEKHTDFTGSSSKLVLSDWNMQGIFFSCSSSSEFKGLYFSHYNDDCLSLMNLTEIRINLLLVIPPSMWNFNKGGRRALRFMIFGRKTDLNCK